MRDRPHQALEDGIDLVVWVDASDIEQVISRYAHAAHAVEAAADHLLGRSAESDAGLFLQWLATTRRPWLIILDDLTDPEAMQAWWPPSSAFGCGRVVATTRRHDAVLSGGGRAVVDIDTYSAQEAEAYLHERLSSAHAAHLMDSQAGVLAGALGYLPLALSHAAAYMVNEDVPCTEYLHRFNDSTARLDDLLPRTADTEGYGRQVAAALLLSLDVAQASEPVGLAVPVMRLAAVLDPAGHPVPCGPAMPSPATSAPNAPHLPTELPPPLIPTRCGQPCDFCTATACSPITLRPVPARCGCTP